MHVSKAEITEYFGFLTKNEVPEPMPRSYFSLSSEENAKYNEFRLRREEFHAKKDYTRKSDGQQKEIALLFKEVAANFFDLPVEDPLLMWGEDRSVIVGTPYVLITESPKWAVRTAHWFTTNSVELSCTSKFEIGNSGFDAVVRDILKKSVPADVQDGMEVPFLYFRGDGLYFAGAHVAKPFLITLSGILQELGNEKLEELEQILKEYCGARDYARRALKNEYERTLHHTLAGIGLVKNSLGSV